MTQTEQTITNSSMAATRVATSIVAFVAECEPWELKEGCMTIRKTKIHEGEYKVEVESYYRPAKENNDVVSVTSFVLEKHEGAWYVQCGEISILLQHAGFKDLFHLECDEFARFMYHESSTTPEEIEKLKYHRQFLK